MHESFNTLERVIEASQDLGKLNKLLKERKEYVKEEKKLLPEFLINGSILLNNCGEVSLFYPETDGPFDLAVPMDYKKFKGRTVYGGNQYELPSENDYCICCGKKFTLNDIYSHNFHKRDNEVFHSGECKKFIAHLKYYFSVSEELILLAKRALGDITNIKVSSQNNDFINITFDFNNYHFTIKVQYMNQELTIICKKNEIEKTIFSSQYFCSASLKNIEAHLKKWKADL